MSEIPVYIRTEWKTCKKCGKKYLGKMTLSSNPLHHMCPECQSETRKNMKMELLEKIIAEAFENNGIALRAREEGWAEQLQDTMIDIRDKVLEKGPF